MECFFFRDPALFSLVDRVWSNQRRFQTEESQSSEDLMAAITVGIFYCFIDRFALKVTGGWIL